MKKLKQTVLLNIQYTIGFILFLLINFLFILLHGDKGLFLKLNIYHTYSLDIFFTIYTFAGDGIFSIAVGLILLVRKKFLPAKQVFAAFVNRIIFFY